MKIEQTNAITLQSIAYKDRQKITTLFTEEKGLITVIVKNLSSKKPHLLTFTTPLCLSNIIYKKSKSDIYLYHDSHIIEEHLFLRKKLENITVAFDMVKAVLKSQLPHKQNPHLFLLFVKYLKKIDENYCLNTLYSSFILKLLLNEGILNLHALEKPESLKSFGNNFTQEELPILQKITYTTSFQSLKNIEISDNFKEKVKKLFLYSI